MTNQTLMNYASTSSTTAVSRPPSPLSSEVQTRLLEAMRSQYRLDQQVKFLHLQAEAETLLQQLQVLKQQRQSGSGDRDFGRN